MRVFLMLGGVLGNIGRIVHASEQIKEREDKNPDKIDKVPEESADFDAIGQMFGIALIKSLADWQPHVNENDYAAEHVRPVQTGDGEVTGKIGAMPWTKRIYPLNVFLLNRRDMVGRRNVKEMWTIVRRIVGIHIKRIKTDFI